MNNYKQRTVELVAKVKSPMGDKRKLGCAWRYFLHALFPNKFAMPSEEISYAISVVIGIGEAEEVDGVTCKDGTISQATIYDEKGTIIMGYNNLKNPYKHYE